MSWKPTKSELESDYYIYMTKDELLTCFNNPETRELKLGKRQIKYWYILNENRNNESYIVYEWEDELFLHTKKGIAPKQTWQYINDKCTSTVDVSEDEREDEREDGPSEYLYSRNKKQDFGLDDFSNAFNSKLDLNEEFNDENTSSANADDWTIPASYPTSWEQSLERTIKGFHIINSNPIVERNWEEVFVQAQTAVTGNVEYECGSHKSGVDCLVNGISYSNKTSKIKNGKLSISSYRLTKCDNKIKDIIEEIDVVRKNFQFYALLAREETSKTFVYRYYEIPADFFKAKNFTWTEKKSKSGKFSGWKTNEMNGVRLDISECMSSQLWIHVAISTIAPFLKNTINVNREGKTVNFSAIYELYEKNLL